jgi:hypothetical protein
MLEKMMIGRKNLEEEEKENMMKNHAADAIPGMREKLIDENFEMKERLILVVVIQKNVNEITTSNLEVLQTNPLI